MGDGCLPQQVVQGKHEAEDPLSLEGRVREKMVVLKQNANTDRKGSG